MMADKLASSIVDVLSAEKIKEVIEALSRKADAARVGAGARTMEVVRRVQGS